MASDRSIITFTTDFGLADAYVAEMKAAALRHCPGAVLVDITHLVPPQDIVSGAIALERAVTAFGPDTIHVAVVDPGVGTERRLLLVRISGQMVLCPDNGIITWSAHRCGPAEYYELTWRPARMSATFHGRDILAPAAGMLAAGTDVLKLGREVGDVVLLDLSPAVALREARIIHIDHFGNATTNVPAELLHGAGERIVSGEWETIGPVRHTYGDVAEGKPVALIGSSGLLEIAVRQGSAAEQFGLKVGDKVIVE